MGEKMFQKKDVIFSETLGVCKIEDIVKLSADKINSYTYYVLRAVFAKEKIAYIPVEHHSVLLRELISKEEAEKITEEELRDNQLLQEEVEYVLKEIQHKKG